MLERAAVVVVSLMALCMLLVAYRVPAEAKESRFIVGQTYMVVWECFPVQSSQPCYVEALTVKAVHDDGWIDVWDEQEIKAVGKSNLYTVNPAKMIGFSLQRAARVASAKPLAEVENR